MNREIKLAIREIRRAERKCRTDCRFFLHHEENL